MDDIENMKVNDLKKRLKTLGLPLGGNKSELVERLQSALISERDENESMVSESDLLLQSGDDGKLSSNTSDDKLLDEPLLSLSGSKSVISDSDLLLQSGDGGKFSSNTPDDKLLDISLSSYEDSEVQFTLEKKTSPVSEVMNVQEETAAKTLSLKVPLKKRVIQTSVPADGTMKIEKRIHIKRDNIPTPKIISFNPVEPEKKSTMFTNDKNGTTEVSDKAGNAETIHAMVPQKVVHLSRPNLKSLTNDERILMRAKRFNLSPESQNVISLNAEGDKSAASSVALGANIDVLKKRSERFGVTVSSALKKGILENETTENESNDTMRYEDKQKMEKRKARFQGSDSILISNLDENEKKKKRAERFGM